LIDILLNKNIEFENYAIKNKTIAIYNIEYSIFPLETRKALKEKNKVWNIIARMCMHLK